MFTMIIVAINLVSLAMLYSAYKKMERFAKRKSLEHARDKTNSLAGLKNHPES